jgi:hypothetical protein
MKTTGSEAEGRRCWTISSAACGRQTEAEVGGRARWLRAIAAKAGAAARAAKAGAQNFLAGGMDAVSACSVRP